MKKHEAKKAFTLIELLVVITIIGILATGAVTVYTSQIQKARDTTRITDMNALKGGLEQAFQDMSEYPGKAETISATQNCDANTTETTSSVYCVVKLGFLNALPKDPKDGKSGNKSSLVYTYNTKGLHGVPNQQYEISTGVESDGFVTSKANNSVDGGGDANRIEFGVPGVGINTCINGNAQCSHSSGKGDSAVGANTTGSCKQLTGTDKVVVIRGNCL